MRGLSYFALGTNDRDVVADILINANNDNLHACIITVTGPCPESNSTFFTLSSV